MALDIDVNFDFKLDSNGKDPDIFSEKLRDYQQKLYTRETIYGNKIEIQKGNDPKYDYLFIGKPDIMRLAGDCVINMNERYPGYQETHNKYLASASDYYRKLYQEYIDKSYTIGGEIIFPKRPYSINVMRGIHLKDRFDLTLECVRRFYNNEPMPLRNTFEKDRKFFNLFGDFDGYVNFFFLDDLVKDGKVQFFFGKYDDDVFNPAKFAWEKSEWEQLLENQIIFLQKRNERIKKFCRDLYE